MALHHSGDPDAGLVAEARDGRQLPDLLVRRADDRARDRMLGGRLHRSGKPEHLVPPGAVQQRDPGELEPPLGDGAGLVEHDGVDPAGLLEHLGPADQDPQLRPPPRSDHERHRRGQAERAGAGDDEDRDRGGEGVPGTRAGGEPAAERGEREHDHGRDEDGRDAVGESLDGSLARLSLLDQPPDLRERGVGADLRRAHDEPAVEVHRGAGDLVPGPVSTGVDSP